MGAERDDSLAMPVVLLNERIYGHRHITPPVGVTDEDDVVILYRSIALNGRTGLVVQFMLGNLRAFRVAIGIRNDRQDLEKFAFRFCGNHFGYDVGIPLFNVSYGIILACP